MSYQEKRTAVSIVLGLINTIAYTVYALNKYQSGTATLDNAQFWANTMLTFIGIGIIATIVTQIVFHILLAIAVAIKEKEHDEKKINAKIEASIVEDEMDKLIELKSLKFGFMIAGIGFLIGLISLVLNYPIGVMLNVLFYSFAIGSIIEGFMSLHYYKNGV